MGLLEYSGLDDGSQGKSIGFRSGSLEGHMVLSQNAGKTSRHVH